MKNKDLNIAGEIIRPGEKKVINLNIARLVSGTAIDLPIFVYRSKKEGPVVLLSGGLHGDEMDGVEIIRRMIKEKTFRQLQCGTVIAIPVLNIYGFLNFSREVPDGKDVNRFFPGSKTGSLASRVAYNITHQVLQIIDFGIDFHSGGANRYNYPQCRFAPNDKMGERIAKVFNAPISLTSKLIDRSLRKEAFKAGKSIVVFEGGESKRFDEKSISTGIAGAKKVLHHFNMLKIEPPTNKTTHCAESQWVRARRSGLVQLKYSAGETVKKNTVLAHIADPFGKSEIKIKAPFDGIIVGHSNAPLVNQGDALFLLGKVENEAR